MKIYYDNSSEILKRSRRIDKFKQISATALFTTIVLSIFVVIALLVFKAFNDAAAAKVATRTLPYCLFVCLLTFVFWALPRVGSDEVKLSSKSLCLVKGHNQDTLAIFSGEQNFYIDPLKYEYIYYPVKQYLKLGLSYGSGYAAYFVLKFYISPQALTDASRHALMRNIKHKRTLKKSILLWLATGFQVSESGNLEITQEFLDKNPFGFCAMRIKFLKITQRTNNKIKVI